MRYISGALTLAVVLGAFPSTSGADIGFEEVGPASGVNHVGLSWGAAWGDFNGDRWPDLWANNHFSAPSLFVNNGDRTFTNVSPSVFGLTTDLKRDTHGVAWCDMDNDGDSDIIELTGLPTDASNSRHNLYINDAFHTLNEVAGERGIAIPNQRGRGPQWVDIDNDALLDLVVSTAPCPDGTYTSAIYRQTPQGFEDITNQAGFNCPLQAEFAALSDLTGDGVMDIICAGFRFPQKIYDPTSMPFTDVSAISPKVNSVLDASFADFNNDLRPDMFLTRILGDRSNVASLAWNKIGAMLTFRAFIEKGFEFRTHGELDVTMTIQGSNLPIYIGESGWQPVSSEHLALSSNDPTTWGVKSHTNSDLGLYIGYYAEREVWHMSLLSDGWTRLLALITSDSAVDNVTTLGFAPQAALPPVMLMNQGGTLENRSAFAGIDTPAYCSVSGWGDFDNDMDVDLYMVCEHSPQDLPNMLYENLGNGSFVAVPNAGGADGLSAGGIGRNVTVADYDVDGFLDLFVQQGRDEGPVIPWGPFCCGPDLLFHNVSPANGNDNKWIELDLMGTVSNNDGIGATVIATAGSVQQLREQNGGMQHGQQRHQRIHFGLGPNTSAHLEIRWPSGLVDHHWGVAADRLYLAYEGGDLEPVSLVAGQSTARIADTTVVEGEGATAQFNVSLSQPVGESVAIDYATRDGTAAAGLDYTFATGRVTFPAGATTRTISVSILNDAIPEATESFTVDLTGVAYGDAAIGDGTATATIYDDDGNGCGAPVMDPATDKAVFLWTDCTTGQWHMRVAAGGDPAGVDYIGRIRADSIFDSASGYSIEAHDTLNLGVEVIDYTLRVWNAGTDGIDFSYPAGSSACFELDSPAGASVRVGPSALPQTVPFDLETLSTCGGSQGAEVTVHDTTVTEGEEAVARFDVSLSQAASETVEVRYATIDGSATTGLDYTGTADIVTFEPGETWKTVSVPILNDAIPEATETFTVQLTGVLCGGATIADGSATGTIYDDDGIGCGPPVMDPSTDKAVFLWSDCATGQWHMRATAGGDPAGVAYVGQIGADTVFDSAQGVDIEAHDTLTTAVDRIGFTLRVWNDGVDGIDFGYPAGSSACFELGAPVGVPVRLGPLAVPQSVPLDLETLSACH